MGNTLYSRTSISYSRNKNLKLEENIHGSSKFSCRLLVISNTFITTKDTNAYDNKKVCNIVIIWSTGHRSKTIRNIHTQCTGSKKAAHSLSLNLNNATRKYIGLAFVVLI